MAPANSVSLDASTVVGVVGAGAMGTGIAQVASAAGHRVVLADSMPGVVDRARASIAKALAREVEKKRTTSEAADALIARIDFRAEPLDLERSPYRRCGLVVEAIVEDLAAKRSLMQRLSISARDAVLATNTSSLSVTAIAAACPAPDRVIGLHFFNPPPLMPLVEVVPGAGGSSPLEACVQLMRAWGKVPVVASDTPGFIVNRVARPFYGESIRILEEGIADCATIDWAMRELGGFRMGPFELMDFIGNDVNYAVTRSVYEAMFHDPRYKPSITQQRLVEAGRLGRKSGRGYYDYSPGAVAPEPTKDATLGRLVVDRVLAMLMNEAVDAVYMRVASPTDVDLAMTRGVNYPKGLLAWADELGAQTVLQRMERLQSEYGEDRYRPSPLLRRTASEGSRFVSLPTS
jgi:3-hydroxybutyryl-CoA dehydrogenase